MGVYSRQRPGGPKNYWISYSIPKELAQRFGVKATVREPAAKDQREAERLLARRRKEIRDGTWRPASATQLGSTLATYVAAWTDKRVKAGVKGARDELQRLRDHVLPKLGGKALGDISRNDVLALVDGLKTVVSKRTQKLLAPRTQRHVYGDLRALYMDALADGLVLASPCTLRAKRGELPKKKDADPRWRARALFSRSEIRTLITDQLVPEHRRVLYGLVFIGAMRIGEGVARTWDDYDTMTEPLGKLIVATQHDEAALKTDNPREMPVHPTLALMLERWRAGYELRYGRKPAGRALIVPNHAKTRAAHLPIDGKRAWHNLQRDLRVLGLRRRRVHDLRRTFITLALADGGDKYLLKFVTHGRPKGDAFDDYASPPWPKLCQQVGLLKISLEDENA
jgi:integrase